MNYVTSKRSRQSLRDTLLYGALAWAVVGLAASAAGAPVRIEKRAADFEHTTIRKASIDKVRKDGYLTGSGEATYRLAVPQTGWYELYVAAAGWATDLFLDGEFLIHTAFASGVWETGDRILNNGVWKADPKGAQKTLNLFLTQGKHTLKFSRPWHPGLPWMRGFYLQQAVNLSGRARLTPEKDYLVFRRGEAFTASLLVGRSEQAETVVLRIAKAETGALVRELRRGIPAGAGNMEERVTFPTDAEGVFDIKVLDADGKHVDRTLQYCVVDTRKPEFPTELQTELVETIDTTTRKPDFTRGETRVVETPLGVYRESGSLGREGGTAQASWFAYTLNLPEAQADYLMRIDYPDDDQRQTAIVLVERHAHPNPAQGYSTGGVYPLSETMQTQDFYLTARDRDPRVMFYNWNTGQRAAAGRITIHRVTSGFPALKYGPEGRLYGMYQEEPMRFLQNFGAKMGTKDALEWPNFRNTAERVGQRLNFAGINLWFPTIGIYGSTLWPSKAVPGYQIGILPPGPATTKEPFKKDVLRLMLLTAEKYGLNVIGDLVLPNVHLDKRFGADPQKPWVTISRKGERGAHDARRPYYNAVHPGVQTWAAEVFQELAGRYRDYPSFKGLRIRLMLHWSFEGWQCFHSLDWGYEDYTVALFTKDTGIQIPVATDDPKRFQKRYEFLVRNHYEDWVAWRCRKVYEYHSRLAKILTAARPEMKLILSPRGDDIAKWRETGIDPKLYAANPAFVLETARTYPDPVNRNPEKILQAAGRRDGSWSAVPLGLVARKTGDGTVCALHFGTNHEGPYAKGKELGYEKSRRNIVYPDATLNPPGIHYLQRFANAMADGNITLLHDGSHGYVLGQPTFLRPFVAEYRALPPIGMQPLGDTDPAVLWHGRDEKHAWFYLVNRAWYPVEVAVTFSGTPRIERVSTGEMMKTTDNRLPVTLKPYQLLAFRNQRDSGPTELAVTVPAAVRKRLRAQFEFIENTLSSQPEELEVVALSPEDLRKAESRIATARKCLEKGQTWSARKRLLHSDMIKLYEAFHAYPPGLMNRKTFSLPPGALKPGALLEKLESKTAAQLKPSAEVAPGLSGEQVLLLGDEPAAIKLEVPFAGKYRFHCAFVIGKGFAAPAVHYNGRPIPLIGEQRGTHGGLLVSAPVVLDAGPQKLTLTAGRAGRAGLLGLHLEPVYRDLLAAEFRAIGPLPGFNGWLRGKDVVAKMEEPCFPEDGVHLDRKVELNGKTLSWVTPQVGVQSTDSEAPNYICLYRTFGEISVGGKGSISYAYTEVESPEARPAQLNVGADYWAKIWANGEVVFRPGDRPAGPPLKGESQVPISLRKGTNPILLKIHAGSNGNGFWLSITDPGDLDFLDASLKGGDGK